MGNGIELVAHGDTPQGAAGNARIRLLGMLCEMPSDVMSIGFSPSDTWKVRTCNQDEPRQGPPGPIVARGTDEELDPWLRVPHPNVSDRAWSVEYDADEGVWTFAYICYESEDTYPTREAALEGLADFLSSTHQQVLIANDLTDDD
jgi:hypothetical protein